MEKPWFKKSGLIYIPQSLVGWLIFLLLIAYWVYSFIDIDKRSHSVSDTLINFIINALFGLFAYLVIARYSSK
ncbi:hypothetical protein N9R54_03855 [Pelobium sp.]|nr:hypothetical protein [Pelobium sp.]MDA9555349.1 hypothetical protein [Pelobium sp.]